VIAPEAAELVGSLLRQDYSPELRNIIALTALSLLPVILVGTTSFTRIVIVLSLLRHALGLPQTPPNSVLVVLAVCLTWFSMGRVVDQVDANAIGPYLQHRITAQQAIDAGSKPVRAFMIGQTRESDLRVVLEVSHAPPPRTVDDIRFSQLMPAFLLSELKTAFQIGFVLFLPFLVIDLVVAAALMALGMIMVPPATISLPLKLLLFVLVDGWALTARTLLGSYWT
jgi:flagellar biosynthetic protein FliP